MLYFAVSEPNREPRLIKLGPGKLTIGRSPNSDIKVEESMASYHHAEVLVDPLTGSVSIVDLHSTNGTYVNRHRVRGVFQVIVNDIIRIGKVIILLVHHPKKALEVDDNVLGTYPLTAELLLESIEKHSELLYEVSNRLNTVLDINTAMQEMTDLLKQRLDVEKCEIRIGKQIYEMDTSEFCHPLAKQAMKKRCAEVTPAQMFVPIMDTEELMGLMIVYRLDGALSFNREDLQVAIAISHQVALTVKRINLIQKLDGDEQIHRLLLRFVSPPEAKFMLNDYLETGELPGLSEQKITVLFTDIANSTSLAEHMGTGEFAQMLKNFYKITTEIAFKYNGIVKYLGDGVLIIFTEQANHWPTEERALLTGQELIHKTGQTGSLVLGKRIILGVAINTGKAMVGYVGTHERAEFVVLGDTVNVAHRMQEYARPYKVIVGPNTIKAISNKYRFQNVGAVTLKGREHTIQVYEVLLADEYAVQEGDSLLYPALSVERSI